MSGEPVQKQKQTGVVRMERVFRHPPEAVWRALTDPKALSQCYFPPIFAPSLGIASDSVNAPSGGISRG